ncbi:hypothetical protein ABZS29_10760 [Kribbella sp. NPDC005582]|uniref:hypothetical protein n=1 Tax=Kribbella sp. NPDC005582 TaxID=3156893 RepID=UPI0033A4FE57
MRNRPAAVALNLTSRWSRFASILVVAVLVVSGVFGDLYVRDFVAHLGTAVAHDELALRALGWCWLGVPVVVLTVLLLLRHRLSRRVRGVVSTVMFCLAASSAMLPGGRRSRPKVVFGDVYPDAQPLSYGWASAGLTIVAMLAVSAVVLLVAGKIAGRPLPAATQRKIAPGLGVALILLAAGGLWIALAGPLPT